MHFTWTFDAISQTLHAPSGQTTTVREIAVWKYDMVCGKQTLTGPWTGWRVDGKHLVGPKGVRFTPQELRDYADQRNGLSA